MAEPGTERRRELVLRHSKTVRVTHWINALCLTILLMSGLQIFNAHPALYWGPQSDFAHPALAITAEHGADGAWRGYVAAGGARVETTGVLGVSPDAHGAPWARAFPTWATLPSGQSLAQGRQWHFFVAWLLVANGLIYWLHIVVSGRLFRRLLPSWWELLHLPASLWDHARLRFPRGEAARHYNVVQKLTYLVVIFGLLPLVVLAGLAMSPTLDAAWPWLPDVLGGRQSARTLHFIAAALLLAFAVVHVLMVLISGVFNNIRSMLTGYYAIGLPAPAKRTQDAP